MGVALERDDQLVGICGFNDWSPARRWAEPAEFPVGYVGEREGGVGPLHGARTARTGRDRRVAGRASARSAVPPLTHADQLLGVGPIATQRHRQRSEAVAARAPRR